LNIDNKEPNRDQSSEYLSTWTALAYGVPGIYRGMDTSPLIKVRKSSRISLVSGSSDVKPSTCFTITLNENCEIKSLRGKGIKNVEEDNQK
jgi:hypothetical protein